MNFFRAALPNMIAAINTAYIAKNRSVIIPTSKFTRCVLDVLSDIGIISHYEFVDNDKLNKNIIYCKIYLLYINGERPYIKIHVVSKGSKKYHINLHTLLGINNRYVLVLSTNHGIVDNSKAAKYGVGGLVLLSILI